MEIVGPRWWWVEGGLLAVGGAGGAPVLWGEEGGERDRCKLVTEHFLFCHPDHLLYRAAGCRFLFYNQF
jgi:hypothetical protein